MVISLETRGSVVGMGNQRYARRVERMISSKDACKKHAQSNIDGRRVRMKAGSVLEGFKRKRVDGNPILRGRGLSAKKILSAIR